MFSAAWKMLKETVLAFINDEAMSRGRGAAIAFYTVTSIASVLLIVRKTRLTPNVAVLKSERWTC